MSRTPGKITFFKGQLMHGLCLLGLLAGLSIILPAFPVAEQRWAGISNYAWLMFGVGNAILHQIYVWLCWRAELTNQTLNRWLGDNGFLVYQIGFAIFILLRPLISFALGWADRGSLSIPASWGYGLGILLLAPSLYLIYSVRRYFGFKRAFGIDHFDESYRALPLVRQGIFTWTPNAMYVFGFLILWVPAFLFQSYLALLLAAFSHLYIWVHYYCTEKPDMEHIYGQS
jgi:protein-S-isoprenylcysteine O-methyltransferase Ste14